MKLNVILAAAASCLVAMPVFSQAAGPLTLIYNQPLEGVYSQDWSAQVLGDHNGTGVVVYVAGEGKSGDFFGVISVNCQTPSHSRWLATGGFISPDSVPDKAVQGIRHLACAK